MSSGARTAGVIALWLGAMLVGFYVTRGADEPVAIEGAAAEATTLAETTTTEATPVAATTTSDAAPVTTTTDAAPVTTTTTTTTTPPQPDGATVVATLENGQFLLSGVVPDQATKDQIEAAAATVYLGGLESSLEVSSDATMPEWFAGVPRAVTLLPIIGSGTITLTPQGTSVTGSAPNGEAAAVFTGALGRVLGVEIADPKIEITSAGFPDLNARRQDDTVTLTGTFADESAQANIVDGAIAVYGEAAVVDETTIGEDLDTPYWTYTMPTVLYLLAPFPDYEIDIRNGVTGGSLNDGANFEIDSAQLSQETEELLVVALAILTRDPSLGMQVAGHTDWNGPDDLNQRLSEARAASAAAWLTAAGIDEARIATIGHGESRPIASNETSAGRASNRRVEFVFGPLESMVGG